MKILDIGANNGDYAKRMCVEDTLIVSVEPNPNQRPNLDGYNIVWEQKAVSDTIGYAVMHLASHHTLNTLNKEWISRGRFAGYSIQKSIEVPTTTIDELWNYHGGFDHIKLDVEGYENVALRGMTKNYGCPIQFEWASEWINDVTENALRYLYDLGYRKFNVLSGEGGIYDFNPFSLPKSFSSYEEVLEKIRGMRDGSWGMILVR